MGEHNPKLEEVIKRSSSLAPVTFIVKVQGSLAVHLINYAIDEGVEPETIIGEALRAYLGDA